jgi:hypothetical protein
VPEEGLPTGVPTEEFGQMIFEKISSVGDRTNEKTSSVGDHDKISSVGDRTKE